MLSSQFDDKTFEECHKSYERTCDSAIRIAVLCAMMDKASTRAELEIVHNLAHPNSITRAQAIERLELLDQNPAKV